MNDNATRNTGVLPTLSDEAMDRLEASIFDQIDLERSAQTKRATRKRRTSIAWATAAAATVVVGALALPTLIDIGSTTDSATSSVQSDSAGAPPAADMSAGADFTSEDAAAPSAEMAREADAATDTAAGAIEPQVITTTDISITVADIQGSVSQITDIASEAEGYVSSQSVGSDSYVAYDTKSAEELDPADVTYGWVSIRVPADSVDDVVTKLEALGEVTATNVNRMDVTQQTVDLDARIDSLTASVARLQELMTGATTTADLLAAETALSQRQAELESLIQQRDSLADQVAMSTVSVNLAVEKPAVKTDPAGFKDGLNNGWDALIAAFNGLIIAAGFILPWLAIVAVVALIIWLIVRARRRRPATSQE